MDFWCYFETVGFILNPFTLIFGNLTWSHLTFVILLNIHFWNYYGPLRTWNPLQPLRLNSFWIEFYLHPRSQLPFITFLWVGQQGERCVDSMIALWYPTSPPQRSCFPPHLPIIYCQGEVSSEPHHYLLPRAAGECFSFCFAKFTHLVFPLILSQQ